jgi:pyruvate dehydrogenase E1 component
VAATVPNCRAYDPAYAYEVAVIVDYGARQMMMRGEDVFYYLTVMNENYAHPSMPPEAYDDIIKGMHRIRSWPAKKTKKRVRLLGSGAILPEVLAAADLLRDEWSVEAEVWSVTSFSELARDARSVERWNMLHPQEPPRSSHVAECLAGDDISVAATDYVRAYPNLIATYVPGTFATLGTDGFGRSATRADLRRFFEVDRQAVVVSALHQLAKRGTLAGEVVADAIRRYGIDAEGAPSWDR